MVLPVVASGSVTEFPQLRPGGRGRERNGGTADSERWTRLAAYRITRVRGRHREHLQGRRPGRGGELRQVFTAPGKLSRLRASICVGSVIPAPSRMRPPTDRPERGATGGRVGDAGTGRSIASHVRPGMSGGGAPGRVCLDCTGIPPGTRDITDIPIYAGNGLLTRLISVFMGRRFCSCEFFRSRDALPLA